MAALSEHLAADDPGKKCVHPMPAPEELLGVLLGRLSDSHPVMLAALSGLQALMKLHPAICAPQLACILTELLRAGVRLGPSSVETCFCQSITLNEPATFLACFGALLAGDSPDTPSTEAERNVALVLAESSLIKVPRIRKHLASGVGRRGAPMLQFIEDLLCAAVTWTSEDVPSTDGIWGSIARVLHSLFLQEPSIFLASVTALHPASQTALCSLLAHHVPELSESLKRHAMSEEDGRAHG